MENTCVIEIMIYDNHMATSLTKTIDEGIRIHNTDPSSINHVVYYIGLYEFMYYYFDNIFSTIFVKGD